MEKEISVVKRRDRGRETLNIEKIHEMQSMQLKVSMVFLHLKLK